MDAITTTPMPRNEPVRDYAPGSPERASLQAALAELGAEHHELTVTIDGEQHLAARRPVRRGRPARPRPRARHRRQRDPGGRQGRRRGRAAGRARRGATLPFDERAAVLLRAADLLAGPWRDRLNAATMLGQSKTCYQAEIDSACELADFWRFNVAFGRQLQENQPVQRPGRVEPGGLPAAGGLRLRDHAVQLHRDRRQPAHRARADGQHGDLEALAHPEPRRAPDDAAARGGRACRPA